AAGCPRSRADGMAAGGPGERPARPAPLRAATNVGSMTPGTGPPGKLENLPMVWSPSKSERTEHQGHLPSAVFIAFFPPVVALRSSAALEAERDDLLLTLARQRSRWAGGVGEPPVAAAKDQQLGEYVEDDPAGGWRRWQPSGWWTWRVGGSRDLTQGVPGWTTAGLLRVTAACVRARCCRLPAAHSTNANGRRVLAV